MWDTGPGLRDMTTSTARPPWSFMGSGTSGSKYNSFKVRLAARNNVYLNYKNMPAVQLAVNLVPILVGVGLKHMFFRKRGFARDYGWSDGGHCNCGKCRKVPYRPQNLGIIWP